MRHVLAALVLASLYPPHATAALAAPPGAAHKQRTAAEEAAYYESLYKDTHDPASLWKAGVWHANDFHDAKAIVYIQRALAAGLTDADAAKAQRSLTDAKARTAVIRLAVVPESLAAGATLELRRSDDPAPLSVDLTVLLADEMRLHAEPGAWEVTFKPAGEDHEPVTATFTVAQASGTLVASPDVLSFTPTVRQHTVTFRTPPGGPPEVRLILTDAAGSARREVVRGLDAAIALPAGKWTYTAEAVGHAPISGTFVAAISTAPIQLVLTLTRQAAVAPVVVPPAPTLFTASERRALGWGIGAPAIGLSLVGMGYIAWGVSQGFECDENSCPIGLDSNVRVSLGAGMLGAGVGAGITAVTARFTTKHSVLVGEGIIGTILTFGGAAWYASEIRYCDDQGLRPRETVAVTLLGVGGGMLGGSVINLITHRVRHRRVATQPILSANMYGFAVSTRF